MHPERLGAFEIRGVLGEGGSSIVYAASDGGEEVALKVLHPDAGLATKDVERFLEEAERMRRVSHENLVPVLGAGILPGGRPFIRMPLLRGKSLAERLDGRPLDLARAIPLFGGLCRAVAAVHDAGLVHRDIKPENVVWPEAEDRLVLLDLGIARDSAGAPSTTTQAGMTRGTPAYMAPERFFGKQASVKSDVYELALVLFVMLVGRLPWDPEDPQGRLSPRHPIELGVRLAAPLSAALMRALSVEADARPQSALALLAEIERAAGEPEDGVATRDSPPRQDGIATPLFITPGADAHARTEMHVPTPLRGETRTAQSPGAPATPGAPYTPVVEIVAAGGSRPPPRGSGIASAVPNPTSESPQKTSGVALLAAGGVIALVGALGGAVATGAIRLGSAPSSGTEARVPETSAAEAASPGPRDVFSSQPTASASAEPAPSASSVPSASAAPTTTVAPTASGRLPSPSATQAGPPSSAPAASGPAPPACQQLVALMCSPTSGARPEECTAWKGNVARWQSSLPPNVVAETCQAALSTSQKNLPLRKGSFP